MATRTPGPEEILWAADSGDGSDTVPLFLPPNAQIRLTIEVPPTASQHQPQDADYIPHWEPIRHAMDGGLIPDYATKPAGHRLNIEVYSRGSEGKADVMISNKHDRSVEITRLMLRGHRAFTKPDDCERVLNDDGLDTASDRPIRGGPHYARAAAIDSDRISLQRDLNHLRQIEAYMLALASNYRNQANDYHNELAAPERVMQAHDEQLRRSINEHEAVADQLSKLPGSIQYIRDKLTNVLVYMADAHTAETKLNTITRERE